MTFLLPLQMNFFLSVPCLFPFDLFFIPMLLFLQLFSSIFLILFWSSVCTCNYPPCSLTFLFSSIIISSSVHISHFFFLIFIPYRSYHSNFCPPPNLLHLRFQAFLSFLFLPISYVCLLIFILSILSSLCPFCSTPQLLHTCCTHSYLGLGFHTLPSFHFLN